MFAFVYQIFRPILSFILVGSFAFFLISLLMVATALSSSGKITVSVDTGDGQNPGLSSALLLCLATFVIGIISLGALYYI